MSDIEKYRQYFTKEYLMGPNSFRLLDELIRKKPSDARFHRTLDLGCSFALTSLFIANETDADYVYAYDLWVPATENYRRIRENHLEDRVIPIHGDAMDMPFAHEYFDAIVSVDAYHYFGCREGVFAEKILPFVRSGGYVMIAVPGIKEKPEGNLKQLGDYGVVSFKCVFIVNFLPVTKSLGIFYCIKQFANFIFFKSDYFF